MPNDEQPSRNDADTAVIDQFQRIYGAVGETARADRTMLGLWFTVLTGRPATALVAYRRLVDDYLPWVERRLVHRARRSGSSWAGARQAARTVPSSGAATPRPHVEHGGTLAACCAPVTRCSRAAWERIGIG